MYNAHGDDVVRIVRTKSIWSKIEFHIWKLKVGYKVQLERGDGLYYTLEHRVYMFSPIHPNASGEVCTSSRRVARKREREWGVVGNERTNEQSRFQRAPSIRQRDARSTLLIRLI